MSFFRSKAGKQALAFAAIGVATWVIGVHVHAYEVVDRFVLEYHAYQLDNILLAAMIVGLLSLISSFLRVRELRQEILRGNQAEQSIRWIADHDSLTMLFNRQSLEDRLAAVPPSVPSPELEVPLAVFSIDLDNFKAVNDLVGHRDGDQVLVQVAERLKSIFPYEDIFRVGGDEFIAIMKRDGDFNAHSVGRRVLAALAEPISIDRHEIAVTASIGYAFHPDNGKSVSEVVRCSDVAMFSAKTDRYSKVRAFDSVMRDRLRERSEMEMALREAIRTDAVVPYYQPIIDLKTGKISGFEALARWERSPGRFIPPMTFVEVAEQCGLIVDLTDRLLRKACLDALSWPDDIVLSFNISPAQLHDGALGLRILQILTETGLPPRRLEIEITETALIGDLPSAEQIISDLRNAQIGIALDDFGTGYSTLAQLSRFSFDKIKIDRSFLSDVGDQSKKEKIMRAIVALGKGLNIFMTAEGIETEEQLNDLTTMGCNLGQGYFFGKAMTADDAALLFDQASIVPLRTERLTA